jgi:hypothetical protein
LGEIEAGMTTIFEAETVGGWTPLVRVSQAATRFSMQDELMTEARVREIINAGYEAPAVTFAEPHGLVLAGRYFITLSSRHGMAPEATYLVGGEIPMSTFFGHADNIKLISDREKCALVAGNIAADNYYHWTLQVVAAAMAFQNCADPNGVLLLPKMTTRMRDLLILQNIALPYVEIEPDQLVAVDRGTYSNLTGGDFAFHPHPRMLDLIRRALPSVRQSRIFSSKIYVSRQDSTKRRIENEKEVEDMLERYGFDILLCSELSVADQIAAFRDAHVIISPHGAALTNLLYCDTARKRPKVIELMSSNNLNLCFLRMAQVLGLDYRPIINGPLILPPGTNVVDAGSTSIDIGLLEQVVQQIEKED